MSRILELEQKAIALQQKRQRDTEKKLENGINQIFSDTKNSLIEKAESLKESIDSVKEDIQTHHNESTAQLLQTMADDTKSLKAHQIKTTTELLQLQKQQVEDLKASLQKSNLLNQEIIDQVRLKKALTSSSIVLASVALILLISSICLGYVSKSKLNEINAKQARLNQIEAVTNQKIQEYNDLQSNLYKLRNGK